MKFFDRIIDGDSKEVPLLLYDEEYPVVEYAKTKIGNTETTLFEKLCNHSIEQSNIMLTYAKVLVCQSVSVEHKGAVIPFKSVTIKQMMKQLFPGIDCSDGERMQYVWLTLGKELGLSKMTAFSMAVKAVTNLPALLNWLSLYPEWTKLLLHDIHILQHDTLKQVALDAYLHLIRKHRHYNTGMITLLPQSYIDCITAVINCRVLFANNIKIDVISLMTALSHIHCFDCHEKVVVGLTQYLLKSSHKIGVKNELLATLQKNPSSVISLNAASNADICAYNFRFGIIVKKRPITADRKPISRIDAVAQLTMVLQDIDCPTMSDYLSHPEQLIIALDQYLELCHLPKEKKAHVYTPR